MFDFIGEYQYAAEVTSESFELLINAALKQSPQALMIYCCDRSLDNTGSIDTILNSIAIPVFGGVFPAIIMEDKIKNKGLLVVPIHIAVDIKVFRNLERLNSTDFDSTASIEKPKSAMVLVDGISRSIDSTLNLMFERFGKSLQIFGGGAGSLSFERKPCLFSNQGLIMDAMIVVFMPIPWKLAIGHGWEILDGPFLANEVNGNQITQLNFQPALDVYLSVIEGFEGKSVKNSDFIELSKTYPFGLERLDDDVLVRDPVSFDQSSLVCVGKVPENTMLYILKGDNSKLVSAAVNAVENLIENDVNGQGMLFDCVSRYMFLGNDFDSELKGIASALSNERLVGVLALGEIASGASGYIHFHNKTVVTAITHV